MAAAVGSLALVGVATPVRANEIDWVSGQHAESETTLDAGRVDETPGSDLFDHGSPTVEEGNHGEPINVIEIVLGVRSDSCSPINVAMCAGAPGAPPKEPAAPVVVTLRDIASFR